jgi:hypothetical protein
VAIAAAGLVLGFIKYALRRLSPGVLEQIEAALRTTR